MVISSNSNEKVKQLKRLIKSSKERVEKGVYIVEGIRMFKELPKELLYEAYVTEEIFEKYGEMILDIAGENYHILSDSVFNGISDTKTPQGILCVVRMKNYTLEDIYRNENQPCPFILAVEKLQDPGNLGTIIRTAEAAGVTGIILSRDSVDLYNPKVVRSTMGSVFRVPTYISKNLKEDIEKLKAENISVYGAHLKGESMYESDFKKACAFLIGNEGNGLSGEISLTVDKLIHIPMKGKVESLNAAISASVICYEVLRQRL